MSLFVTWTENHVVFHKINKWDWENILECKYYTHVPVETGISN